MHKWCKMLMCISSLVFLYYLLEWFKCKHSKYYEGFKNFEGFRNNDFIDEPEEKVMAVNETEMVEGELVEENEVQGDGANPQIEGFANVPQNSVPMNDGGNMEPLANNVPDIGNNADSVGKTNQTHEEAMAQYMRSEPMTRAEEMLPKDNGEWGEDNHIQQHLPIGMQLKIESEHRRQTHSNFGKVYDIRGEYHIPKIDTPWHRSSINPADRYTRGLCDDVSSNLLDNGE